MGYVIAFGGILGTGLLAFALFGGRYIAPLRRTALGAVGLTLAALMWAVHPNISGSDADSSFSDEWP
jgi:hypothetical protein